MNREDLSKLGVGFGAGVLFGYFFSMLIDVLTRKASPTVVQVLPVHLPQVEKLKFMPEPAPSPVPPSPPILLTANPIPVVAGRRYRCILGVGFPLALMASPEVVRQKALELGFVDVKVYRSRPSDFPGKGSGDFFVDGKWGGGGTTLARPNISGIRLIEVWEG